MKLKKAIVLLENNIKAYEPFLYEWSKSENCSLNLEDLSVIEPYLKNNFKVNFFSTLVLFKQKKRIQTIVAKLIWDYQKFKDWIIHKFVFSLVKMIKKNNYNIYFLHLPLDYIDISYELKNKLKLFKIKSIYEIFEKYKVEDFYRIEIFKNIIAFEKSLKNIENKTGA